MWLDDRVEYENDSVQYNDIEAYYDMGDATGMQAVMGNGDDEHRVRRIVMDAVEVDRAALHCFDSAGTMAMVKSDLPSMR